VCSSDLLAYDGFHYVALGHLHRPQTAGAPHIRYSGSLLPYSFSEAGHSKSVTLVDMGPDGACDITPIPLEPRRSLRIVTGFMDDILQNPASDDYIQVSLLDTAPVLDAIGKLKTIYPNLLNIERPHLGGTERPDRFGGDHRKIGHQDLFASFFREVTGETLTPAMEESYARIVNDQLQKEREAL
jgi:exonuclease SbcD